MGTSLWAMARMRFHSTFPTPASTNFDDEILSMDWNESELENDDLENYKAKAEFYVRQHQDETVIAKLKSNVPLDRGDVDALEHILWSEVGSKADYEIVEYIVRNGMMKDLSVLQEAPFTDQGSIVEVFTDLTVWQGIRAIIERINANAVA